MHVVGPVAPVHSFHYSLIVLQSTTLAPRGVLHKHCSLQSSQGAGYLVPPRAAALRLGDGPAATPELDGELLGRQVAHQLLLRGQPRGRVSGEGAPVEVVAL